MQGSANNGWLGPRTQRPSGSSRPRGVRREVAALGIDSSELMKSRYLRHKLSALAQVRGVTSCVLVDADSGLIWERSETMDLPEHGAELMIDFWRLYQRAGGAFRTLGPLRAIGLQHEKRNVHVMECVAGVLLVVTSIVGIPVDEATLAQKALELGQLVER